VRPTRDVTHLLAGQFGPGEAFAPGDLDLVIPALNEEARIGVTIAALSEHLATRPWRSRILVVDNGSVDGTAEMVDGYAGDIPVEVIGCKVRGKGAAVRVGVSHSTARWVGYCDADLSTSPRAVDAGIEMLRRGYQVVVGSRRCEGGGYIVPQSLARRIGSQAFHLVAGRLVPGISDTQCGFKLFAGEAARRLFTLSVVSGFAFDVEILALGRQEGMAMIEIPVEWSDRRGSTFRPTSDGLRAFSDLRVVTRALMREPGVTKIREAGPR
jgi:dolichyl-phosphate beta-glucosyltransferase